MKGRLRPFLYKHSEAKMMKRIKIDLKHKPTERWSLNEILCLQANELLGFYLEDIGLAGDNLTLIDDEVLALIPDDYLSELKGIARLCGRDFKEFIAGNLYYDFMKMVFGCTAFSSPSPDGPFHSRNLDWLAQDRALSRFTLICDFVNGPCGDFATVGWPGIVGALSGVAKGRFAITLNAAMSSDKIDIGFPVAFLIRNVLETVACFDEAVDILSHAEIPCDCLLLVTGTTNEQAVVIERTPKRYAHRWAGNGKVCVTNDFHILENYSAMDISDNELVITSCNRLNRVKELLNQNLPEGPEVCLEYLSDEKVKMQITEQQMVFQAGTGLLSVL